jgi:hypothetical protein
MGVSEKHSAAFGGRIGFFRALFSLILLCKINENSALKKYFAA